MNDCIHFRIMNMCPDTGISIRKATDKVYILKGKNALHSILNREISLALGSVGGNLNCWL